MRILLVEDEQRLGQLLSHHLREGGMAVDHVMTLADADIAAKVQTFDAILLDRSLPDGDGVSWLAKLKRRRDTTPVLIMTARDTLADRVNGLDNGADDYLVKPFAIEELMARVRALLRRPGAALGRLICTGNVTLDTVERAVTVAGVPVSLARHELAALECLMIRAGRVVTREVLIDQVYGADDEPASNAVPVHIHNLRKRLLAEQATAEIVTFRGLGYLLKSWEAT